MLYKISNTAERITIEKRFGMRFKFPKLYKPVGIINGLKESVLPVITMEHPDIISYGIWGILPGKFDGNWEDFQGIANTLLINEKITKKDPNYKLLLNGKRCLIVVTGFFTSYLKDDEIKLCHVQLPSKEPFLIAGIYNNLKDGFITCSVLTVKSSPFIKNVHNINKHMPLIIGKKLQVVWMDKQADISKIKDIIDSNATIDLVAHPMTNEFYKNKLTN